MELLPNGRVSRREGGAWKVDKDTYWKVVDKRLIVGGLVGTPSEWCNLGPLVPSGNRFDGLTMDHVRTRYVRTTTVKEAEDRSVVKVDANGGSILSGDLLICWGRADLIPPPGPDIHVRAFSFTFPHEFAFKPAVMTGLDVTSSGNVFGIYASQVNTTGFSGAVYDNKSNPATPGIGNLRVAMSYLAIGKPKTPPPNK
jgi:hypothetical protein